MGLFSERHYILDENYNSIRVTREEKIDHLYNDFLENGDECTAILPEMEMIESSPIMKAIATKSWGLAGLALTMGQEERQKAFRAIIRPAAKGLVISEEYVKSKDMRIPWDSIYNASKEQKGFSINLIDNSAIEITGARLKKYEEYNERVIDYINSNACGVVEEGWD